MVIHLYALILIICLICPPVFGGQKNQQCLTCHQVHFAERGSCAFCHAGNPESERENIAHYRLIKGKFASYKFFDDAALRNGQLVLEQFACRRCHVSAGKGNNLAANLDSLLKTRSPEEIVDAILKPVLGMPDFKVSKQQVVMLVNAILDGAKEKRGNQDSRYIVHFKESKGVRDDIFSKKCGACHQALTAHHGVLGVGKTGPNLSGLLSPWYPKTFKNSVEWNRERLQYWLKNPRNVRSNAGMQPVTLSEAEFKQLVDILAISHLQ